jgi:MoaA/NifB/PqqE/SkfB family radical SAM enzyme
MTYSASIKEQKENKYRFVMSCQGMTVYDRENLLTVRLDRQEAENIIGKKVDFDKYDYHCEVAHLEISNRCNMKCPYCYIGDKDGIELNTDSWKKIIHNLAQAGIFQVTFGGGEPTLRADLFWLAEEVNSVGMNLGMTTNGLELIHLDAVLLKKYFKQINVSWHSNRAVVEEALKFLSVYHVRSGINYTFSKELARDNEVVKELAREYDSEVLYLVYKPVIKDDTNQIPGDEVYKIAKEAANQGTKVAVDGPCINKCLMKKKFVDVDRLGNVYPCSFVRKSMGNLLEKDFKDIWKSRGPQEKCPYVELKEEARISG